jgi:hypothetical protein
LLDHAAKFWRWRWKLFSGDRSGGVSLTQRARDLLCKGVTGDEKAGKLEHCEGEDPASGSKIHAMLLLQATGCARKKRFAES